MAHDAQPDAIDMVDDDLLAQPTEEASANKASKGESAEVLAERCDFLYRRITPAIVATIGLSLLLSLFLWRSRPHALVIFWQVTIAWSV